MQRRADVLCSQCAAGLCRGTDLLCLRGPDVLRPRSILQLRPRRPQLLCAQRVLQHGPQLLCSDRLQHVRQRLHSDAFLLRSEEKELPFPPVGSGAAQESLPEENLPGMGELVKS